MEFDKTYFSSGNYSGLKAGPLGKYFWSKGASTPTCGVARTARRSSARGRLRPRPPAEGRFQDRFEAYGVDLSPYSVDQSAKTAPRARVRQSAAEDIDEFEPDFFDALVSIHVIEHLAEPEDFVRKTRRILRPGGLFFMVTPNLGAPLRGWKGREWQGLRDETHISLKYPDEWLTMLRRNGFSIKKAFGDGMWDIPYVKHLPNAVQWPVFALPAAIQVLLSKPFIPVRLSESLVLRGGEGVKLGSWRARSARAEALTPGLTL